jgi:hypothetical protein
VQLKIAPVKEFFRVRDELGRREQNLWQQMRALIAREIESKVRASFGSHLILLSSLTEPGSAPGFFICAGC